MPKENALLSLVRNRLGEGPAEYTDGAASGRDYPNSEAQAQPFLSDVQCTMATVNPGRRRRRMGLPVRLGCGSRWWLSLAWRPHEPGAKSSRVKTGRSRSAQTVVGWCESVRHHRRRSNIQVRRHAVGPADKAGLVGGDVITSFDGHQVRQLTR